MSVRPTEPLGPEHVSRYRSFVARRREPGGNQFNRSGEEFIKSQLHRPQCNRILKSLLRLPRDMTPICHFCPLVTRKGSAAPMLGLFIRSSIVRYSLFHFHRISWQGKFALLVYAYLLFGLLFILPRSALWGLVDDVPTLLGLASTRVSLGRRSRPGLRSDRLCVAPRAQRSATTVTTTKGIAGRGHALAFLFWCNRLKSVPTLCLSVKNMFQFYAHYLVPPACNTHNEAS